MNTKSKAYLVGGRTGSLTECDRAEIPEELGGHLRCDRPFPVPTGSKNLAFVSQFVEIPDDVVVTVEYSVRAAQMAVYELLGIDRKVPAVTPHAQSHHAQFDALLKAFK